MDGQTNYIPIIHSHFIHIACKLLLETTYLSSYLSVRVYCFRNACDALFLPRDWRPLYSVVVLEREKCNFHFQLRRVIFRGTAHRVIVIICIHVFQYCSIFFSDLADLLHFVHSDIYLISQASFFLRVISKLGNSKAFYRDQEILYSLRLFRRYCKYKSNIKNRLGRLVYTHRKCNMLYPRSSSVRPIAISCPLFNSWTTWRDLKKLGTHVNHFEPTYTAYGSDGFR